MWRMKAWFSEDQRAQQCTVLDVQGKGIYTELINYGLKHRKLESVAFYYGAGVSSENEFI